MASTRRGIVVFSGGSAANNLVDVFNEITQKRGCSLSYIIPISDNGGSSSELIRVFGGPGIGDIRSRLVRLIPATHPHIHTLFNHRLPPSPSPALLDWQSIVAGTSDLWPPIPPPQRELIRSMLNHVNLEILKRARPPHSTFNFTNASIGNLFLTGARLFTGSFESAIYLLTLVGGVNPSIAVIPGVNSNFSHHISARLQNGEEITGQNAISHPSVPTAVPNHPSSLMIDNDEDNHDPEDANLPGSLPTLKQTNIIFSKSADDNLPAPIERVWYINPYGQEIRPVANPKAVSVIGQAEAVVFSIGSLYTSIVPCLILRGIGRALATTAGLRYKILILNGSLDRETGPREKPMNAAAFVAAIARAAEESRGGIGEVDRSQWRQYVSHVVYLEAEGVPKIDKRELAEAGIECVRSWGLKAEDGSAVFDLRGLMGALEAILGRGEGPTAKSRRNTFEGVRPFVE